MTQTDGTSVIHTAGLTKVFRDFWLRAKVTAVEDLSLDVLPGEVFGLLGPNGSGKSTTLKMVLGLLHPTRGRVTVFGKLPTDVRTKSRIGFLPEDTYLYPFLDAHETRDYYGRLFHLPRPRRRRRIDMLLDMVELSSVAYRRVGEYSKGMQRRIGLAQALINDPDLLILDEPTSGMDPVGSRQFKDLIVALARRGKTIVLSSHLLADVEDVCDRVSILYGGRERAAGRVDELLTSAERTQIVTERLDEGTLERVCAVLDGAGKDVMEVTAPRDKLESLFLRIVEEARRQRVATSGAAGDGRVAEFLRDGPEQEGEGVIESLVGAGAAEERAEAAPDTEAPSPVAPEPQREVLEELAAAEPSEPPVEEPAEEAETGPAPAASKRREEADRAVLDELLSGSEDEAPEDQGDEERS